MQEVKCVRAEHSLFLFNSVYVTVVHYCPEGDKMRGTTNNTNIFSHFFKQSFSRDYIYEAFVLWMSIASKPVNKINRTSPNIYLDSKGYTCYLKWRAF
jgi:hypothetical protein